MTSLSRRKHPITAANLPKNRANLWLRPEAGAFWLAGFCLSVFGLAESSAAFAQGVDLRFAQPTPAETAPGDEPADNSHQMRGHLIARGKTTDNSAPQPRTVVAEGGLQWRTPQKSMQKASGYGKPSLGQVHVDLNKAGNEVRPVDWQTKLEPEAAGAPRGSRLQPIRPIEDQTLPRGDAPQELPRLPAATIGRPGATESLLVPSRGVTIRPVANPIERAPEGGPNAGINLAPAGESVEVNAAQPEERDAPPAAPRVPPVTEPATKPGLELPMPEEAEPKQVAPPKNPRLSPAAPIEGEKNAKVPCPTAYFDRSFCKEGEECIKGLKSLNVPLNKLSLDLTPPLDDNEVIAGARERELHPFDRGARRVWFDRNGSQVYVPREGQENDPQAIKEPLYGRMVSETENVVTIEHVYKGTGTKKRFALAIKDLNAGEIYFLKGRPWYDHDKQLLATGRLVGFKNELIQVETEKGIVDVPFRDLGSDELAYLNASWKLPNECQLGGEKFVSMQLADYRHWHCTTFMWKASGLCHKPLYFEDVNLERYGHSRGPLLQPLASTAHFFGNVCILPYNMGMDPPGECQYALGYYRPGNCAPWQILAFPLSARGALAEAGVVTGIGYLIP